MIKNICFLILLIALSFHSSAQLEWKNFSIAGTIYNYHDDGDNIWLSSQGALFKFDKTNSDRQIFRPDNSPLKGIGIDGITQTDDGTLWFGSLRTGLYSLKNDTWTQYQNLGFGESLRIPKNLTSNGNEVWFSTRLNEGGNGPTLLINYNDGVFTDHSDKFPEGIGEFVVTDQNEIWMVSQNQLFKYDGINPAEIIETPILNNRNINQIEIDQSGNIYLMTTVTDNPQLGYSLAKFDGTSWKLFFPTPNQSTIVIGDDQNVYLNIVDSPGIFNVAIVQENIYTYLDSSLTDDIPGPHPRLRFVDSDSRFWFYSYVDDTQTTIYGVKDNEIQQLDTRLDQLSSNYLRSITEDCSGNILVGDHRRINIFEENKWSILDTNIYTTISTLVNNPVTCDIWFTGFSHDSELFQYDGTEIITHEIGGWGGFGIDISNSGKIVFASALNGLWISDDSEWLQYDQTNAPFPATNQFSTFLYHAIAANDGTIWVVAQDHSILRFLNDEWTIYNTFNSALSGMLNTLYEDNQGSIWTWSGSQIFEFKTDNWDNFEMPYEDIEISSMVQDAENNYWIATYNHGLFYWDRESFINYNLDNSNIGANYASDIFIDSEEQLWLLHNWGMSKAKSNTTSSKDIQDATTTKKLIISPNPTNNTISIKTPLVGNLRYELYSSNGNLVKTGNSRSGELIHLVDLPEGVYILKSKHEAEVYINRIIKSNF